MQGQTAIAATGAGVSNAGTFITAQLNLSGAPDGLWDVAITNPDGTSATLPGAFTVKPGIGPLIWVRLIGYPLIRPGITETFDFIIGNVGDTDAYMVPFMIEGLPPGAAITPLFNILDPTALGSPVDWTQVPKVVTVKDVSGRQTQNIAGLAPVLPAGGEAHFPVQLSLPAGDSLGGPDCGGAFDISYLPMAENQTGAAIAQIAHMVTTLDFQKSAVVCLANIANDLFGTVNPAYGCISSIVQNAYNSPSELKKLFQACSTGPSGNPENCRDQGLDLGETLGGATLGCVTQEVPQTLENFKAMAEKLHEVHDRAELIAGCDEAFAKLLESKQSEPCGGAIDPNTKLGPLGTGPQRYISVKHPLSYQVAFTNDPSATASARQVIVTDQLDTSKFNLTSFVFGPVRFGSTHFFAPLPGNPQSFATTVDLRPTQNLVVRMNANLNASTGQATWTFTSIDPTTGLPPADPSVGFLPPDMAPPNGEGAVAYSVKPLATLTSGTVVSNAASIVFDQNAAISTQPWTNTLDSVPPSSHVNALPTTESSASFPVSWSGTDDASGVEGFTIWVSDNGGSFSIWDHNTTLTSDTYRGVAGHTYAFYSIAQDYAGNIEGTKTQAEATTKVSTNSPPIAMCQNATMPTDPGICTASSASINNGSSDPDGDTISLSQAPPGPYSLGATPVTLTVTDSASLTATCMGTVTVVDKQPPMISCPSPVAECTSPKGAAVSFIPTVSDNCPNLGTPTCTPASGVTFALGSTPFSCSVADGSGNSSSCTSAVKVQDTTPPKITSVTATPNVLWPPNHEMVPVTVLVSATDTCDPNPSCTITGITSNEAGTPPTSQITGNLTANLRAERLGTGTGRIYTIGVQCSDASGNKATGSTSVSVPHNQ